MSPIMKGWTLKKRKKKNVQLLVPLEMKYRWAAAHVCRHSGSICEAIWPP